VTDQIKPSSRKLPRKPRRKKHTSDGGGQEDSDPDA
jgi:hypothetical protein